MKINWMIGSLIALSAGAAFAADSPWVGTWKVDPQRSHFTGQTFTYSRAPKGMLHYEDGSSASFDFRPDGKPYKTWADRTTAWTAAGSDAWDTTSWAGGKLRGHGHIALSTDGRTLTMTFIGTRPDGTENRDQDVFTRVAGSHGLIGTWRATEVSGPNGPQTFVITSPSRGVLHYEIPDMNATAEGRADGTDHPVTGPTMPPGMTIRWKLVTPTKVEYLIKMNGKSDNAGVETIAADGTSFTDVNWNVGHPSEKTTAVYVKQ